MVGRVASWIAGLMRENYEAVGFIPEPAIQSQYVANERYVLAMDERSRRVGYILHGKPQYGRSLNIAQHCIQDELRRNGNGERALRHLVERARSVDVSVITVRCATDLESLGFWTAQGFELRDIVPGGQRRGRSIARLWLPISAPLFEAAS